MRASLVACLLLVGGTARADFDHPGTGEIAVRDVPGSGRRWQEGHAVVAAPPEAVRRWLTEFEYWPGRFRDVEAARVIARGDGAARIWIRSAITGRGITLQVKTTPAGIFYEGRDGDLRAFGRIFVIPTGDGRTDVIMQLGGGARAAAALEPERAARREKLAADLADLGRLASAQGNAARRPPLTFTRRSPLP